MTQGRKVTKANFLGLVKDPASAKEVKRYLVDQEHDFIKLCNVVLRKELKRYVLRLIEGSYKKSSTDIAEEVVDRFFSKWNRICDNYNPAKGNFYGYAIRCVKNELSSFFREEAKNVHALSSNISMSNEELERKFASQQDLVMNDEQIDMQLDDVQVELVENLQSMFDTWPLPNKLAFAVMVSVTTHGDKGGGYGEIARRFGVKEASVRSWTTRAESKVKSLITAYRDKRRLTHDQALPALRLFYDRVREYYMSYKARSML